MTRKCLASIVVCLCWFSIACTGENRLVEDIGPNIFSDVPLEIDLDARFLIYLHGAIIEREGVRPTHPEYGVYEYQEILELFADRGFVVISEARPSGTDGMLYASTVVSQVEVLLDAGVPPEEIHVATLEE